MRFAGLIRPDGSLRIFDETGVSRWGSKRKGQRIEIDLRDEAAVRSDQANRYWWGVCIPFVQEVWSQASGDVPPPKEAVHDVLVRTFGGCEWKDTPLGPALERKSSAQMSKEQFGIMIEAVRDYALKRYNSVLPEPEGWDADEVVNA